MAHQTDVHVIHKNFDSESRSEKVNDPACGRTIERQAVKHIVFRGPQAIYFCSRECKDRFLAADRKKQAA